MGPLSRLRRCRHADRSRPSPNEKDQAYWTREKRNWPIDLMGGQRNRLRSLKLAVDLKVCRTVLNTERLLKDEAPGLPANATDLEFYEDCFLILANEEARVRRTHGALENRPPAY